MTRTHGARAIWNTTAHALFVSLLALALPVTAAGQQDVDSRAFERLKRLVGAWDATEKDNPALAETVTYTMSGRGSVLIEAFNAPTNAMGHMLTAYHLDVGRLVLTHFCGAGNQPRMRVSAIEDGGKRIAFQIYDITNLGDPDAYYSTRVEVVFLSDTRVDLVYRGVRAGKEMTQVFQLARRSS
jgi:hypothetical protein